MQEEVTDQSPSDIVDLIVASRATTDTLFAALGTRASGLTNEEVAARRLQFGANALRHHRAQPLVVLFHQLQSPLLILLAITAGASYFLGERESAIIIGVILCISIGLSFINEYRAERAAQRLHDQIRHNTFVRRSNTLSSIDVVELVPGDIVELNLGQVVPADIRIISQDDLECDESIITGESAPRSKQAEPLNDAQTLTDLASCALMGTVVHHGHAVGIVVATGQSTAFGRIALRLSDRVPQTEFQHGLSVFSLLLIRIALTLTTLILAMNLILHRPLIDALLFSLAIAVGLTPQLLPAVVSTSLAAGSHALKACNVLVKRLVCIEDLGDITLLLTDKTGTLTTGKIAFSHDIPADPGVDVRRLGLASMGVFPTSVTDRVPDSIDGALWEAVAPIDRADILSQARREQLLAFDHERRRSSSLCMIDGMHLMITRGAPDAIFPLCANDTSEIARRANEEFRVGHRVIAVAQKEMGEQHKISIDDERDLTLKGLLVFEDPPRPHAKHSLKRLSTLGITLRIVTGDHPDVAIAVCETLDIRVHGVLTGAEIDNLDDTTLFSIAQQTTIFARVGPEHKARIVRIFRQERGGVAFLGDGVNDALALHAADVGITVDTAADIAKDASDVILLEKNLDVLADGVVRGRQIFANTMKYVLMETSSNFGNVFSAAGASMLLPFLPMLPSQILLNNLLYGASQLTIPTDYVDAEQLTRPTLWDIHFIRQFMLVFGPISSVFDFVTFGLMLSVFHAQASEFQSGWFIESLATQTLIILAIRTRRLPFYKSRPSWPLVTSALVITGIGSLLPYTPLGSLFGFRPLPAPFFLALLGMILCYLGLVEAAKFIFFRMITRVAVRPPTPHRRRVQRRSARFTTGHPGNIKPRRTPPGRKAQNPIRK